MRRSITQRPLLMVSKFSKGQAISLAGQSGDRRPRGLHGFLLTLQVPPALQWPQFLQFLLAVQVPVGEHFAFE